MTIHRYVIQYVCAYSLIIDNCKMIAVAPPQSAVSIGPGRPRNIDMVVALLSCLGVRSVALSCCCDAQSEVCLRLIDPPPS